MVQPSIYHQPQTTTKSITLPLSLTLSATNRNINYVYIIAGAGLLEIVIGKRETERQGECLGAGWLPSRRHIQRRPNRFWFLMSIGSRSLSLSAYNLWVLNCSTTRSGLGSFLGCTPFPCHFAFLYYFLFAYLFRVIPSPTQHLIS